MNESNNSNINQTILLTYDDFTRMIDYCCQDNEGNVSREFMDWYIKEEKFFVRKGILIVESLIMNHDKKFVLSFDFTNIDCPEFYIYNYQLQKRVCRFSFLREQNMAMKDISVNIKFIDMNYFSVMENTFCTQNDLAEVKKNSGKDKDLQRLTKDELRKERNRLLKKLDSIHREIVKQMCIKGVYITYAMMYYFIKNKLKEISTDERTTLFQNTTGTTKEIKSTYKYTGYINLNDAKIYKPIIKKNPNEPKREYERHIERWTVKGHYRRLRNGELKWIEPHERGEGNKLEKRVYGTQDEKDVNIRPKVFEVTRMVSEKNIQPILVAEPPLTFIPNVIQKKSLTTATPITIETLIAENKLPVKKPIPLFNTIEPSKRISLLKKIGTFIKSIFKFKF